jgi:hypothetical protein
MSPPKSTDALQVLALPTMVGAAVRLGEKNARGLAPATVAVSLLIPWQRIMYWRQTEQTNTTSAFHLIEEREQTLLIGGSFGLRIGNHVSLGASLYYVHANITQQNQRSGFDYNMNSTIDGWFGALNPRLGLLWKPSKVFSLGVMASLSSFRMFGWGTLKAGVYKTPPNELVQGAYQSDRLVLNRPLPWELRVGVGVKPVQRLTISGDVSLNLPDRYRQIASVDARFAAYPEHIERRTVVNGNLGMEIYVAETVPIRAGVFTNLTAAAPPTDACLSVACDRYINHIGGATSIGFSIWRIALDLGVVISYGRGYTQQLVDLATPSYRWSAMDHWSWQFVIGGNISKAVGESAVGIIRALEPKKRDENSDAPVDSDNHEAPSTP